MGAYRYDITYYGSNDWLEETGETLANMTSSLEEFIRDELSEMFPEHDIEVEIFPSKKSVVYSDDPGIDTFELRRLIEHRFTLAWCDTCLNPEDGSLLAK